jgi:hypothetical protein
MEGRSRFLSHAPHGLLLEFQVLDSGRNDFGLVLRGVESGNTSVTKRLWAWAVLDTRL